MFKISKEFNFCYAHRVHVQKLNEAYCATGDTACKCRHIHGHEGKVVVNLCSEHVDFRAMVVDFKELGWLKDFLDKYIDHKFIIDDSDPMFEALTNLTGTPLEKVDVIVSISDTETFNVGSVFDVSTVTDGPTREVLESYFIVHFIPTSEMLAWWLHSIVAAKMYKLNVSSHSVEWHETPKSCAVYSGVQ